MPTRAFVGVQIPIVDIRPLCSVMPRLEFPSWPTPAIGCEFVRSTGLVTARPRGAPLLPISGEASFVNALGSLFKPLGIDTENADRNRHLYGRLFGAEIGYRIDIGVRTPVHKGDTLKSVGLRVMREKYEVPRRKECRELFQLGPLVSRELCRRTTPHSAIEQSLDFFGDPTKATAFQRRAVHALSPLVVVERWSRDQTIRFSATTLWADHNRHANLWELQLDSSRRTESRQLRAAVWRIHFETEILSRILALRNAKTSIPFDDELLYAYLDRATRTLVKRSYAGYDQHSIIAIASMIGGFDSSALLSSLEYLREEANGTARRIDIILERSALAEAQLIQYIEKVENVVGDKISISNSSNANIVNRSTDTQIAQTGLASKELLDELKSLTSKPEIKEDENARQALEDLIEEVEGPKRFDVAKKLWERLKNASPVMGVVLAAASLAAKLFGA